MNDNELEKYLPLIEDPSMGHEEKMELIAALHHIVQVLVDLGFSEDSTKLTEQELINKLSNE